MKFRILHIDSENGWRGGQRQIEILMKGLDPNIFEQFFLGPKHNQLHKKLEGSFTCFRLSMKGARIFSASKHLKKICQTHQIDLLDCHSSNAHSLAYIARRMGLRIPIVVHRRVDYPPSQNLFSRWKYLSPEISHYIAISSFIGDTLKRFGVPNEKITVVKSAVTEVLLTSQEQQDAAQDIREKYKISPEQSLFLNAGALTEQKDHDLLIEATRLLSKRRKDFHVLICGGGPLHQKLEEKISAYKIQSFITLVGHTDPIHPFFLAADYFVMSSRDEGLGTSVLDAINYHLPVLTTNAGGLPEIIEHMETGLISPTRNAEALAHNMEKILTSPDLASSFRMKALQNIRQNFSPDHMVQGNAEVYRSILEK